MGLRPEALPGTGSRRRAGQVDYGLVRRHTVDEFRRGRLSRRDVCDAHPELMRAARNVGRGTAAPCPICEDGSLVLVSFAFGAKLPASGRCVVTAGEMARLSRRCDESTCYVVEVCTSCHWNHLRRRFPLGGSRVF